MSKPVKHEPTRKPSPAKKFPKKRKKKPSRENDGRWKAGQSGNPKGPPRRPEIQQLREALAEVAKANGGKTFLRHFVEQSYKDTNIAIALAKKILPDLISAELDMLRDLPSEEVVRRILEAIDKRGGKS